MLVAQSCLTLCDPMDCSLPESSVHGILQARILEGVAMTFSRLIYNDMLVSGVQQSESVIYIYIYIYIFLFRFFSIIGYYKIFNIVPSATQ